MNKGSGVFSRLAALPNLRLHFLVSKQQNIPSCKDGENLQGVFLGYYTHSLVTHVNCSSVLGERSCLYIPIENHHPIVLLQADHDHAPVIADGEIARPHFHPL